MEKLLNRVFDIYKRMVIIHILTKTTDKNWFHKDTESAYDNAFDVFHKISEIRQDLEMDTPDMVSEVATEAYTLQEELEDLLRKMAESNKDIALDNLIRWLAESSASICWNLRKHLDD